MYGCAGDFGKVSILCARLVYLFSVFGVIVVDVARKKSTIYHLLERHGFFPYSLCLLRRKQKLHFQPNFFLQRNCFLVQEHFSVCFPVTPIVKLIFNTFRYVYARFSVTENALTIGRCPDMKRHTRKMYITVPNCTSQTHLTDNFFGTIKKTLVALCVYCRQVIIIHKSLFFIFFVSPKSSRLDR